MNQKGIPETYALKGGTQAWKTAGYPMEGTGTTLPQKASGVTDPPIIPSSGAPPNNY